MQYQLLCLRWIQIKKKAEMQKTKQNHGQSTLSVRNGQLPVPGFLATLIGYLWTKLIAFIP